jgi:prepilin-type N-terminal cleavage/methylation domain-containing protein
MKSYPSSGKEKGFSLLELIVTMAISTVVMGAVVLISKGGQDSSATIVKEGRKARDLRRAANLISKDLRQAGVGTLTVTTLGDGNKSVVFRKPISFSAGSVTWGVFEKSLGNSPSARNKTNWFYRYTVVPVTLKGGKVDRQLAREFLDGSMVLQKRQVIAHFLRKGTGADPGFSVAPSGALWKVQIATQVPKGTGQGIIQKIAFDVALRN